jgi:hypothetical protein
MKCFVKVTTFALVGVSALALSGCWAKASVSCSIGSCHPQATIEIGTGSSSGGGGVINNIERAFASAASLSFDASQAVIDLTGTDYDVGSTGNIAVTLYDANGAVVASQAFPWTRSGNTAVFSNPASVNAWAAQYPSAVTANLGTSAGALPGDGVSHTLAVTAYYQGAKQASAVGSYPAQCTNPRTHLVSPCAQ